jgi:hypothetical protein
MAIELICELEKLGMEVSKTSDWTGFTTHKIFVRCHIEADVKLVSNVEIFWLSRNGSKMRTRFEVGLGPEKDIVISQSKVILDGHPSILWRGINMLHIRTGHKAGSIECNGTNLAFESVKS